MAEKDKKAKKPNWIPREVDALLDGIQTRYEILKAKLTTSITNIKKKNAWTEISEEVTSVRSDVGRSGEDCSTKWGNLKKEALKAASTIRQERAKTGGGEPPKELSPVHERVLEILGDSPNVEGILPEDSVP